MKKILIPILLLISFFAKAQVPALNDTVRYGSNLPLYTPQYNYGFYQGLRLPYSFNSALGKTDLLVTGKYLRAYYLPLTMTTLGDMIYGGASGVPTRLPGNTAVARMFLSSNGNGTVANAPTYFDVFNTSNTWSLTQILSGGGIKLTNSAPIIYQWGTYPGFIAPATLTNSQNWTLPDASGTIALRSDFRDSTIAPNIDGGFILSRNNPVIPFGVESSIIQQTGLNVLDMWYRSIPPGTQDTIKYAHTINGDLDKYNTPTVCMLNGVVFRGFFPYVKKINSHYIMAFVQSRQLYMATSTDKINWTKINGGSPVLTHSATPAAATYYIFNPAFELVGNTYHLLIEGKDTTAFTNPAVSNFNLSYSFSDTTTLNFNTHLSTTYVIKNAGNPDLKYIASKNAFLLLYGSISTSGNTVWDIKASTGNIAAGLSDSTKWIAAPGFPTVKQFGIPISDPYLIEVIGSSSNKLILSFNYNQASLNQEYNYSYSLLDFYNLVIQPYTFSGFSTTGQINAAELMSRGNFYVKGSGYYGNGFSASRSLFNPNDQFAISLSNGPRAGSVFIGASRSPTPDVIFSNNAGGEIGRFLNNGGLKIAGASTVIILNNTLGTPQTWQPGVDLTGTGDGKFYIQNVTLGATALQFDKTTNNATFGASVTATSLIKSGGTSSQFLKADGSVDATTYAPSSTAVTGAVINWPGTIYTTPTTATYSGGTLTFAPALASQAINKVFAGPASGSSAAPTWRSLVANDIPGTLNAITTSQITINTGAPAAILLGQASSYNTISLNGTLTAPLIGIVGGGTGDANLYINTGGDVIFRNGVNVELGRFHADKSLTAGGSLTTTQLLLSSLNTAPSTATSTGALGEVRFTAGGIYLCTATNTWVKVALATF